MPDGTDEGWGPLWEDLAADVVRVSDRLRSMSETRLEGELPPGDAADLPRWGSRAQAGRGMGTWMSDQAVAFEAAADGRPHPGYRGMPELKVFAAGDQLAVGGHDLLAAMKLVAPETVVQMSDERRTARERIELTLRILADLRRRL